jgi:hypothetical protein
MEFKSLAPHLHSTAEATAAFVHNKFGWTGIKAEKEITPDIQLRPTLQTITRDYETICIEVSESPYSGTLDEAVVACKNECLPVKLFVAIPKTGGKETQDFQKLLSRARRNGVGIIEVDANGTGSVLSDALSLSLSGVRKIVPKEFPPKYRQALNEAESTFYTNPAKGCLVVYEEIESLSRRVASKTLKVGLWTTGRKWRLEKDPWASILKEMLQTFPATTNPAPDVTPALLGRLLGITAHRNDVGHKPKSRTDLIKRNKELRTRFESAVDLLRDFQKAAKPLGVS